MSGWLIEAGPAGTAFALLVVGHVLADFTFQTDDIAVRKHRPGPLLAHGAILAVVHALAFAPLLTPRAALVLAGVVLVHLLVDAVTARLKRRAGARADAPADAPVQVFLGDQLVHLLVLVAAWQVLQPVTVGPLVTAMGAERLPWTAITTGAVYLAAFAFAREGGNAIVRAVLPADGPESGPEDLDAGSLIGTLERWIVLALGLGGHWGAVGLVVAAKSVARFEELKRRPFAEYFLVGTLASVLVAILVAVLVSALV